MIIKVYPDIKRAESLFEMIQRREESISFLDLERFSPIIAETYYEIIKELSTILILLDGFKSIGENSHKDLIDFLPNYKDFSEEEIIFLHDFRTKRNKSSYEGKMIDSLFLKTKQNKINTIIKKLKSLINSKIK